MNRLLTGVYGGLPKKKLVINHYVKWKHHVLTQMDHVDVWLLCMAIIYFLTLIHDEIH